MTYQRFFNNIFFLPNHISVIISLQSLCISPENTNYCYKLCIYIYFSSYYLNRISVLIAIGL